MINYKIYWNSVLELLKLIKKKGVVYINYIVFNIYFILNYLLFMFYIFKDCLEFVKYLLINYCMMFIIYLKKIELNF